MQKYIIDADQINSLIFSVCGEEVKEEHIQEWLDKFAEKPAKGGGEIIAAIAAYLEKETNVKYGFLKQPERVEFGGSLNPGHFTHAGFCQEIATEITAAIAPLVEAGVPDWENAPEWAEFRTVDKDFKTTFWEKEPIPNLNREFWMQGKDGGQWEEQRYNQDWYLTLQQRP